LLEKELQRKKEEINRINQELLEERTKNSELDSKFKKLNDEKNEKTEELGKLKGELETVKKRG